MDTDKKINAMFNFIERVDGQKPPFIISFFRGPLSEEELEDLTYKRFRKCYVILTDRLRERKIANMVDGAHPQFSDYIINNLRLCFRDENIAENFAPKLLSTMLAAPALRIDTPILEIILNAYPDSFNEWLTTEDRDQWAVSYILQGLNATHLNMLINHSDKNVLKTWMIICRIRINQRAGGEN